MTFRNYLRFPHIRRPHAAQSVSYTGRQIAALYGAPSTARGAGKTIGFIELGGGYVQADLDKYFHSLGLTVKPVVFHSINGAKNAPGDPNGADGEVMLDLCVALAAASDSEGHVFMGGNTDDDFIACIEAAIEAKMDAISISWGGPEDQWASATITRMEAALQKAIAAGIHVFVAAGDNGSSDGETGKHVDYPASSPSAIGVGGTSIPTTSPLVEVVWNDGANGGATGGGVSALFTMPSYQAKAAIPGGKMRGVPDVASLADPNTGYAIIIDGQDGIVGGTSAGAPLWAALAVIIDEVVGKSTAPLHAALYGLAGWARDITSGNNGTYVAKTGYDCCTGEGVPIVNKLLAVLGGGAAPTPTPVPTPTPTPVPTPTPTPAKTHTLSITGATSITYDGKTLA